MPRPSTGKEQLVADTALRLRSLQEDLADQPPEEREQELAAELERSLERLVPEERERFLSELLERFPCWERVNGALRSTLDRNSSVPVSDSGESSSPESLAQQLASSASDLDEETKQRIQSILREAGLSGASASGGAASDFAGELAGALKISELAEQLKSERVAELVTMLQNSIGQIALLSWQIHRELEPKHAGPKPDKLAEMISEYLTTDDSWAQKHLRVRLDELSRLAAVLVSSLPYAWRIAQQESEKLSPKRIEQIVQQPGPLSMKVWERDLWEKYRELAEQHKLEQVIKREVVTYIRDQMGQKPPRSASGKSS